MKVTELLKKLDDGRPDDSCHSFIIFDDNSGYILDGRDSKLFSWNDRKGMNQKLTSLWNELNDKPDNWEL